MLATKSAVTKCFTHFASVPAIFARNFTRGRETSTVDDLIDVAPRIKAEIARGGPIVALESTIITHGMPYPANIETALAVEQLVRENAATPATIGILGGRIKVGLSAEELAHLASLKADAVVKCSRRDIPYLLATGGNGGTTVAGTMHIAHRVGITIFATGGIGGVHRDAQHTFDISADLTELGRTPVAVVCAGVKSILDIPLTLEYLETQGVLVTSFGSPTRDFPNFYARRSGHQAPYNLENVAQAARFVRIWRRLAMPSGLVIAVPLPAEHAIEQTLLDEALEVANSELKRTGIKGKDITPFLLSAVSKITAGRSLQANIALIKQNAVLAAQIACAANVPKLDMTPPLVIGAAIYDLCFTATEADKPLALTGRTYNADIHSSAGGVGRNIAECLHKLHGSVNLITAIGDDEFGRTLSANLPAATAAHVLRVDDQHTSLCALAYDSECNLRIMFGNMAVHGSITPAHIKERADCLIRGAPLVVMDSNLSLPTMAEILRQAADYQVPLLFEPTDPALADKPFQLCSTLTQQIRLITPNVRELECIARKLIGAGVTLDLDTPDLTEIAAVVRQIESRFNCVLVTLGELGVYLSVRADAVANAERLLDLANTAELTYVHQHYAAPKVAGIVNTNGAGDNLCAAFIAGVLKRASLDECVALGFRAAKCALQTRAAVPQTYSL